MDIDKIKDYILIRFENGGNPGMYGEVTVQRDLNIDMSTFMSALKTLEVNGLMKRMSTANGPDVGDKFMITERGSEFINRTSFIKERQKEEYQSISDKNFRNKTHRISIWAIIAPAVISIASLGYGIVSDVRVRKMKGEILILNKSIDSLNLEIDSLNNNNMINSGHINEIK